MAVTNTPDGILLLMCHLYPTTLQPGRKRRTLPPEIRRQQGIEAPARRGF
jgi:hypothetical protein